jgi:hypothetical protein
MSVANAVDPELVRDKFKRVQKIQDQMASEQGAFMAAQKNHRSDISEILDEAKAIGVPRKVFKAKLKQIKAGVDFDHAADNLDEDERSLLDVVSEALGDFGDSPLGRAAKEAAAAEDDENKAGAPKTAAAKRSAKRGAALDSLTGGEPTQAEKNAAALEAGIRPLN